MLTVLGVNRIKNSSIDMSNNDVGKESVIILWSKKAVRVGFINTNNMHNNDVGKGGVYAYEAYDVK